MRRKFDQYFTPAPATAVLLSYVDIHGAIFEPCVGDGAIAKQLATKGVVNSNDIDPAMEANWHEDAARALFWAKFKDRYHWVVSNPPFNRAAEIVQGAHYAATEGIAMLLRLSFLEPCENRAEFLALAPPDLLLVLPRISFTGDGKTDSVTCAWFVWYKQASGPTGIRVVTKDEIASLCVAKMCGAADR